MPSRMIHYLVAEKVAEKIPIRDRNRFKIGSLCPDMSSRENGSKHVTHFQEIAGEIKGANWAGVVEKHGADMREDDLYLGVFCHILTDAIWFHDIMEPQVRSRAKSYEEREAGYRQGYLDFHRLNYILPRVYGLKYELTEDRNIVLEGVQPEFFDMVFHGMYQDFFEEPKASPEELTIYPYEMAIACIERCIDECVKKLTAFREGRFLGDAREFYVPVRKVCVAALMQDGYRMFRKKEQ